MVGKSILSRLYKLLKEIRNEFATAFSAFSFAQSNKLCVVMAEKAVSASILSFTSTFHQIHQNNQLFHHVYAMETI